MSKHINVNPDHYKVAGRERQGDAVIQTLQRQQFAQQQAQTERWQAKHSGPPWETAAADSAEAGGHRPKAEGQGRAKAEGGRGKAAGRRPKAEARGQADRKLKSQKTQRREARRPKGPKARRLKGQRVRTSGVAAKRLQPAAAGRSSTKRSPTKRRRTSRPASQHKPRR